MQTFGWKNKDVWPNFLGKENLADKDVDEGLIDQFYDEYSHVTVYHASRPKSPETLMSDGLKIANYEEILEEYRRNIFKYCGVKLENKHLEYAKEEIGSFHDRSLFVVLDDEDLLSHAGHYAIYGSEYLVGITNRISHKFGLIELDCLKRFGTPTVYELCLPTYFFSDEDMNCLVREVNNHIHFAEIGANIDFTFQLYEEVPGAHMVSYYHPQKVPDPYDRYVPNVHNDS